MNMKTNNSDPTKKLIKWIFSLSFLGFITYCISVVMTVGIVLVGIFYVTDNFFHTNILFMIKGSPCGYYGGVVCNVEKLTIRAIDSWTWILILIPILITIFGSRKYDKKYDGD
jgi:hypothetical protein